MHIQVYIDERFCTIFGLDVPAWTYTAYGPLENPMKYKIVEPIYSATPERCDANRNLFKVPRSMEI